MASTPSEGWSGRRATEEAAQVQGVEAPTYEAIGHDCHCPGGGSTAAGFRDGTCLPHGRDPLHRDWCEPHEHTD